MAPFYKAGTLLELCGFARPLLATRSPEMKPFTLFFSFQVKVFATIIYEVLFNLRGNFSNTDEKFLKNKFYI